MNVSVKPKRCRSCGKTFTPFRTTGVVCSVTCAIEFSKTKPDKAKALRLRAAKTEKREGRERAKTIGKRLQEAQRAFNAWILWRDRNQPCICCGHVDSRGAGYRGAGIWNAGHYKPAGSNAALRFDETNVHKQRASPCNMEKSGNLIAYREGLIKRIGLSAVERLEGPQPQIKWTHDQLIQIKLEYRRRLREAMKGSE